jgi:hypothetical protein
MIVFEKSRECELLISIRTLRCLPRSGAAPHRLVESGREESVQKAPSEPLRTWSLVVSARVEGPAVQASGAVDAGILGLDATSRSRTIR